MKKLSWNSVLANWLLPCIFLGGLLSGVAHAQTTEPLISLTMRDTELAEVMEMLSRTERINILLTENVGGEVSFSLYDVPLSEAIRSIANAAGYAAERRDGMYFVVDRDKAGDYAESDLTEIRTIPIQYADPMMLQEMIKPYLSEYGQITVLAQNKMLMVEDTPEFVRRVERLINELDKQPRQILIEAKILEVTLNTEDSFGVDWTKFFDSKDGTGSFGTRGLADAGSSGTAGLFFQVANSDLTAALSALEQDGRIRTLSTPKLLALENQEASVIIGDRKGYKVTTTINQVTTESVEFLESGVILNVTPHVDAEGRILMDIHPEVSTGSVDTNGIPSQTTTEVSTRLLVASGQTVFIGGLIKQSVTQNRKGVPVLGRIPLLGGLFSSRELTSVNTETIVVITPRVVGEISEAWNADARMQVEQLDRRLGRRVSDLDKEVSESFSEVDPLEAIDSDPGSN